jgi:4'-phosphopantetheinyl transferase EntD
LIARASPTRRREIATGRACARRLLGSLGFAPRPLLRASDRTPLWPRGVVGSIAHDALHCVVAVARAPQFAALGVDAETDEPLEEELWDTICTPRELAFVSALARDVRGTIVRTLFSAKECAFKCVFPLTKAELELHDVEIELDADSDAFCAQVRVGDHPLASVALEGFYFSCDGSIVTGMALTSTSLLCAP